ncbi:CDP-glycerol glycerophosphotransferase family protein [Pediococcus cellicola]|uniref:Teichoic acid biosynthesis protein n=1 Tax=Pediococcus cellicola TaxID=319652 RepID=A0A0R2IM98_9LACO|nr:CDP-glycerol glycerophosphotransferase family protein [Pediococcus cellicola]KRN66059.1 hypothetical protein IV80_GL001619 [Pediococcus cellicola]GEL15470.1 teichoic acid biosynthesis protein [Pediococcus cellicola]
MTLIFKLLTWLNARVPKKKDRIVLYANLGFRDNVKALYDFIIKKEINKNYQIICVSNDFMELRRIPGVKYVGLYTGLYYFFTSKFFFYCFGKYPIKPNRNQVVVNLWHGIPLKKIGNIEKGNNKDYNFFNYLLVSSKKYEPIMSAAFKAKNNQLLRYGSPRNDQLFKVNKQNKYGKKVIWMPTYRDENVRRKSFIYSFTKGEWKSLNNLLHKLNIMVYFKPHPLEKQKFAFPDSMSNIHVITDNILSGKKIDLYKLIGTMDAMLTDYSSVALDFLLLNRPIGYIIDDFNSYKKDRGFISEDPKKMFIGTKIVSKNSLINFFQDVANDKDNWIKERVEANKVFNQYDSKGHNSEKILERVGIKF